MALKRRYIIVILTIFLWGINASAAQEKTFEGVRKSVEIDLKKSIKTLSRQRDQIANEKIPLATKLNKTENKVRILRQKAMRFQAIRDSRSLGLDDIRKKMEAWQDENTYVVNLLDEYALYFENSLNVSEFNKFKAELKAYNSLDKTTTGVNRIEVQMSLLEKGLDQIRNSFGGDQYKGNIVGKEGKLVSGTFSRFGPVIYFLDSLNKIVGIVNNDYGLNAHILELENDLDQIILLTQGKTAVIPLDVTDGKITALTASRENIIDHVGKGGIWIFPILLFALISLVISIYKLRTLYQIKLPASGVVRDILLKLQDNDQEGASRLAENVPAPVGPMLVQGVKYSHEKKGLVEEILYEYILEAKPILEKLLPVIAITAATAPLLGLLGTVTGMINTFKLITLFGTGNAKILSSGISEALVTTEFGLIVAIPALIIHAILSRKVKSILADMERYTLIFCNGLPREDAKREV